MELTPEKLKQINKLLWEEKAIVYNQVKGKGFCHINKNKRFGSWIFKGSGSKNLLKQFIAFNPDYKCIAQINDINGYRQFIPFKSWQDCWDNYAHAAYNKRYLYELIISDNYCKPYLDIEWKLNEDEEKDNKKLKKFIKKLQQDLINIFEKRYNLTLLKDHILITECHRHNKISFHVVINCIIDSKYYVYQTNRKKSNQSAWDLYLALLTEDKSYKDVIDESVYSLDREFRAIYSVKFGDFQRFEPLNTAEYKKFCKNYLDYFVTHFDDKYTCHLINTPEYINPNKQLLKTYSKITDIKGNHITDYKNKLTTNDNKKDIDNNKEILDKIYELLQFVHPTAYFTNMTTEGNGYRFSYTDKDEVCFTGHTHKNNGFSVFIKPNNGNIYMYCYSAKCGRLYKLGNLHYNSLWKYEAMHVNYKYLDYKTEIKAANMFEQEDYKFSSILNNFIDNGGNYVIKSNMGTGKTQLLKKIIDAKFKDKRILYLSHRQTFTHNISGTFAELDFYNYLDGLKDICEKDKLIIQIDSLVHLVNYNNRLKYFDMIILDEVESLLSHLSSPTLATKRTHVCLILKQLLKNAKWILSMDADFSNRSYDFLTQVKEKPKIIINDYRSIKKKFMFTNNYNLRCHQLLEDIKNKKNVAIICLSKTTLDELYDKIVNTVKNVKIIRYTSMTDDEQKIALNDVNRIWTQFQVVLYSPTIEAGIDFNKDHFNKIYCFLSNGSCCPRSFLQMIGRIRTTVDDRIRCCYEKTMKYVDKNSYIPMLDDVEDMIVDKDYLYHNYEFTAIDSKECQFVIRKDAFTKVFAYNYIENYEKQVHFLTVLKEIITEKEWEYLNEDAGEKEESDTETIKEDDSKIETFESTHEEPEIDIYNGMENTSCNSSKKTVELDELLDAPNISDQEAKTLKDKQLKNLLTRTEKMSLKKYWTIKKFKLKPDELDMTFLLNWYGKEYILDNVAYALGKKKISDVNDPYLNNIKPKIDYLNKILKVYGFTGLFDFDSVKEKDEAMETRMKDSKLLEFNEYKKLMQTFGKRLLQKENGKFAVSKFIKLSDAILNEFGVGIKSTKKRKQENNNRMYNITYKLYEFRKGVYTLNK